jgi:hypothetical protein
MSRPTGPKQSAMCQLIVVVFDRMTKAFIDRGTRWSIAGFITIRALGDHTFTNDSQSSYKYLNNQENTYRI